MMVQTGAKTLLFPMETTTKITKENLDDELDPMLRRIMDILEELNRRQFSAEQCKTFDVSDIHTCTVTGVGSAPVYTCTVKRYNKETGALETVSTGTSVRDLIDTAHAENTLLEDDLILAWSISLQDDAAPQYVGIQYFGRSTIGLP